MTTGWLSSQYWSIACLRSSPRRLQRKGEDRKQAIDQYCEESQPVVIHWVPLHGSTIPLPPTTVTIRSIAGTLISSFAPSGQNISTLSTLLAPPNPKCSRWSELEA